MIDLDSTQSDTMALGDTRRYTEDVINARMAAFFGQSDFAPATVAGHYSAVVEYLEKYGWDYEPLEQRVGSEKAYTCRVSKPRVGGGMVEGGSPSAYHPTLAIAGCLAFLDVVG